jgi:RNA 2',3'-cyclic 3'-phosphodiesterase
MRIFIGIELAEETREKIVKGLKPFKKIHTSIRWTEPKNIHLTIKFIGEVDDQLAAQIAAALTMAKIPVAPFTLRFSGFGKFPAGDDLHIFWAGVEDNPHLLALFNAIESALFPLGLARETRPFHPHLTLGRNKARYNFRTLFELLSEKSDLYLAECPVTAFQLFSSDLTPAGPVYTLLKEIHLVQS